MILLILLLLVVLVLYVLQGDGTTQKHRAEALRKLRPAAMAAAAALLCATLRRLFVLQSGNHCSSRLPPAGRRAVDPEGERKNTRLVVVEVRPFSQCLGSCFIMFHDSSTGNVITQKHKYRPCQSARLHHDRSNMPSKVRSFRSPRTACASTPPSETQRRPLRGLRKQTAPTSSDPCRP